MQRVDIGISQLKQTDKSIQHALSGRGTESIPSAVVRRLVPIYETLKIRAHQQRLQPCDEYFLE